MFLFLSKLLPLFLYPLGLSCILLLLSLVLLWFKPRWTAFPVAFALMILLVASNGWVSNTLVRSLEWKHLPQGELPQADAIVLLGGSLRPISAPRQTVEVSEQGDRALYAAHLYRQKKAPYIIASGGRVQWRGGGPSEASDTEIFLTDIGVPASAIIQEPDSLNTYENAVNVGKILKERNFKRILLVTSAIHMPRSFLIFKRQGIDAIPAPTDFLVTQQLIGEPSTTPQGTLLNLLPEIDRLERTTKAIKEYIGLVVYRQRGWL
ncbi:YdcF family protein [Lusitaniella coriacea LEGE 07157]|uniref:YdcF family protein n=1 Tax=Lusitaniella coriacea LEGE 07157 TaxID=945747 RepID=A0A8J7DTW5_9CYAN|nr:YdcF family protein [Lusitaniella coriacea]MBE9114381.1 YdcF family protein [Lusitaniella coriacea LEGE 07157]